MSGLISDDAIGQVRMPMFFGFLGLINVVMCMPLLFLLHHTGIRRRRFEPGRGLS